MKPWMTVEEVLRIDPEFFNRRGDLSWTLDPASRSIRSRFGDATVRVQCKPDGSPDFDRVVYGEAPNINCVVWGLDSSDTYRVAVVVQERPFADNPDGTRPDKAIVFGQPCIMGFSVAKLVGVKSALAFEAANDTVLREALEEAGAGVVSRPVPLGHHNPNPTFCATWSQLYELMVDLRTVQAPTDSTELIHRAEYLPAREVFHRIAVGEHEGVNYRSATANHAFFIWLARHPQALT